MRLLKPIPSLALSALLLMTAPGIDASNPPIDVVIHTTVSYLPSESFTWYSEGGIEDSGELEVLAAHWGGIPSPAVGALQLDMRLLGTNGSIDIRTNLVVTATATPNIYAFDGPWFVIAGSGQYARCRGTGQAHITGRVDQLSDLEHPEIGTFTGRVNFN